MSKGRLGSLPCLEYEGSVMDTLCCALLEGEREREREKEKEKERGSVCVCVYSCDDVCQEGILE